MKEIYSEEAIKKSHVLIGQWFKVSFGYLLLVGLLGLFLRCLLVHPLEGIVYKNFLHAHSHIAFLGWVFNALFAGIIYAYLPNKASSYKWIFILLQLSVVGMLISFPIQGYAFVSILFSTLHIFFSWAFAFKVFRHLRQNRLEAEQQKHRLSRSFIKWSLFFMILSAAGPFALGGIMAKGMGATHWYQLAIYFYLHLQYDGWFSFALFGLFFWLLERNHILFNRKYARLFLWLMALACIPAYGLSALWTEPARWVYVVAGIAAGVQVFALFLALVMLYQIRKPLQALLSGRIRFLLGISLAAYVVKVLLQLASALPAIAQMAYLVRNFTIAYLHLVFLGFVSFFLLGWFARQGFLRLHTTSGKAGIFVFLGGFVLTELYLIGQPLYIRFSGEPLPAYELSLALLSILLPAATFLLLRNVRKPATRDRHDERKKQQKLA